MRKVDHIKLNGDQSIIEFNDEHDMGEYIGESCEDGKVYLLAECMEQLNHTMDEEIDCVVFVNTNANTIEHAAINLISTETVHLMEFETFADAYQVWQYFNEGHPLQGETLIPKHKATQTYLAN